MLTPTLFLPGLLCDATLWRPVIDQLADRIAPNVADLTLDSSVTEMAARTLAAAPPRFALVALSMGGYVAFEILRQAPERVTRLALFSTSAGSDSAARVAQRQRGIDSLKTGRFVGVTSRLLPQLVHPQHIGDEVGETVKTMAKRVGGEAFIRQQQAIITRPDSHATLTGITVPTAMIVGADDVLTPPREAEAIHAAIAGSTLDILPDCGHLPALERPEDSAAILRQWLDRSA